MYYTVSSVECAIYAMSTSFGKYIKDYREGKGMPKKAKIVALSMITLFVGLAVIPFSPISIPNIFEPLRLNSNRLLP